MRVSFKIFWALLTLVFLLGISTFAGAVDKPFAAPSPSGDTDIFITSDENLGDSQEDWVTMEDEAVIDAPIGLVALFFTDVKKTITMTPGLKRKRILRKFSDYNRIDYDHYKLIWPFNDRFMIYRARKEINRDDEILITMNSVENFPYEERGKVRGFIDNSSILLKTSPQDEFKTTVTIKMNINPGGWLPKWLVKFHTDSWTQELFKNLREDIQGYLKQKKKLQKAPAQKTQTTK